MGIIIIAAPPRSGTTVTYEILKKSGIKGNGGPELMAYRRLNNHVYHLLGAEGNLGDVMGVPTTTETTLDEKGMKLFGKLMGRNPKLLKDVQGVFALRTLLKHSKKFRKAKYVWMSRDPEVAARSFVDLADRKITFEFCKFLYIKAQEELAKIMPKLKHIRLIWEDVQKNPMAEYAKLGEFVGIPLTLEPYDSNNWKS